MAKNKVSISTTGFTLIEILVTIAIVGLMLVVSVPTFRDYKYRNDLSRGADLIQSAIYETKNLALSPQTDKNEDTGYYVIEFISGNEGNMVSIYEAASESTVFEDMILVKKFDLPEGVVLDAGSLPADGIFYSIEKQGEIIKPVENVEIKISHEDIIGSNNLKTISVNHVTGQVSIK